MADSFEATTVIDRPIDEVFAFLAAGVNDPKFSPRVLEIRQSTDGPVGVGTVFSSKVKDAGFKTTREIEITEFEAPTTLRWAERSKNLVTNPRGGYDLTPEGTGTKLHLFNELQGNGVGKLIAGAALKSARKGADDFAAAIKSAVEAG